MIQHRVNPSKLMGLSVLILSLVTIYGCATFKAPLKEKYKNYISKVKAISHTAREISIQPQYSASADPLVPAAIAAIKDSGKHFRSQKENEALSIPFRDTFSNTQSLEKTNISIETALNNVNWMEVYEIEHVENISKKLIKSELQEVDFLLVIETVPSLSPELELLEISSVLKLYAALGKSRKPKRLYQWKLRSQSRVIGNQANLINALAEIEKEKRELKENKVPSQKVTQWKWRKRAELYESLKEDTYKSRMEVWQENKGEQFRDTLNTAIKDLSNLIANALNLGTSLEEMDDKKTELLTTFLTNHKLRFNSDAFQIKAYPEYDRAHWQVEKDTGFNLSDFYSLPPGQQLYLN